MTDKLKRAKSLRQTEVNRMRELYSVAKIAENDSTSHILFQMQYEQIDTIQLEFSKQHNTVITLISDEDFETEDQVRVGFDNQYFPTKAIYFSLFSTTPSVIAPSVSPRVNAIVPKINLPSFSGDISKFQSYKDIFDAVIHNSVTLTDAEKFHFLISTLTGQPLSLVQKLPQTADNYLIAYETLIKRYLKPRVIAATHWGAIENSPKLISDNPQDLRSLLDVFADNIAALKNFNLPTDQWDFILVQMLLKRIDVTVATKFELQHDPTKFPKFSNLMDYLNNHCAALENVSIARKEKKVFKAQTSAQTLIKSSAFLNSNSNNLPTNQSQDLCCLCKSNHLVYKCPELLSKSPPERYQLIKTNNLCINCLSRTHTAKKCQSTYCCHKCKQRHHTLLHFEKQASTTDQSNPQQSPNSSAEVSNACSFQTNSSQQSSVLLSTAIAEILDGHGNFQKIRILLDSGSQSHFISQSCVKRLSLRSYNLNFSVQSLGQIQTLNSSSGVSTQIRPWNKISPVFDFEAVVIPKICGNLPSFSLPSSSWSHIANCALADPGFNHPGPIDLLLGADLFPHILQNGRLMGDLNDPVAINTIFGFVIMGRTCSSTNQPFTSKTFLCTDSPSLDKVMHRFWEVEEVPSVKTLAPEDDLCESIFLKTTSRDETGRFVVSLPFRTVEPIFPDSRSLAMRNFLSLERRLLKNSCLYKEYSAFMQDYLDSNHMEPVPTDVPSPQKTYYIPHHCVFKSASPTSKLRVVFNGSAKLPGQPSLNECLLPGPKLQSDIFGLLLLFRLHQVVFTADIRQMFRQIRIFPPHADYQRILWRFSTSEPISEYRLLTVTYGLTSAPYLAIKSLLTLAEIEKSNFPHAASVVADNSYVDDILSGASSISEAKKLQQDLISMLQKGGFELRKWCSNEPSLLADLPSSHLSNENISFDSVSDSPLKILGLQWLPASDCFSFSVKHINTSCTKRNLLSNMAQIFDPLGILSPVTFFIKHLIQRLWSLKLDWDQTPPNEIVRAWSKYASEISCLSLCKLSRLLIPTDIVSCEMHAFCDSSEKGYAAVVYFVFVHNNGDITTHFVCGKSKVAPLQVQSIPRLELCAAVLLSRLVKFVSKLYKDKLPFEYSIFAWSDSTITLSWIKSSPHRWKTFVSNRVSFIQERVMPSCWRHVSSAENPADVGSRGLLPSELLASSLWWAGPSFLKDQSQPWNQISDTPLSADALKEERVVVLTTMTDDKPPHIWDKLLSRSSSFFSLQRSLAYALRFVHNLRHRDQMKLTSLSSLEMHEALLVLIKHVQSSVFSDEISQIKGENLCPKYLKNLTPFLDTKGVLRVGGRIRHAPIPFDRKFPIILPSKHHLTKLIVEYYHLKYFHAGVQTVQFLLSQQFWILSSKRVIRNIVNKCITCWKTNPQPLQPPMGDLPLSRLSQAKAFLHTGVDFAGPFNVTMTRLRGSKSTKAYLCLFVCFSTKALHLELVSSLSADAFLAALRRFIARRGRCQHLYSDCGTNFVSASRQLDSYVQEAASREAVIWHFNPPSAPHFGGLWEAGVKSVKTHLNRVIGAQILTYEELNTIFIQIEAFLNSRPITPISNDPHDLTALTPGHFLTMEPLASLPEPDVTSVPISRLDRWQLLQRIHQDFWSRWSKEYLHTLHQRTKWHKVTPSLDVGTLVLIKNELAPPMKWHLARVTQVHPGLDGVVRVATVQTSNGLLKRPVVKLCPLPLN